MNKVAAGMAVAGLGACALAGVWFWHSFGSDRRNPARSTANAADSTDGPERPYRCARVGSVPAPLAERAGDTGSQAPVIVAGKTAITEGDRVRIEPIAEGPLTIGVVADARAVTKHLPAIRDGFKQRDVTLVVSLGGMGRTAPEIEAALSALTGPWFLLASPGDWESLPAHVDAVRALSTDGALDGAALRTLNAGAHTIVTWPGAPSASRTMAGDDGCAFTAGDTEALPTLFASTEGARILMSHTPPRQSARRATALATGTATGTATDDTRAGIHIGDRALARASSQAGASVIVHGLLSAGPEPPVQPIAHSAQAPVILAAGAADGIADLQYPGKWHPLALVITIEVGSVTWEYLRK